MKLETKTKKNQNKQQKKQTDDFRFPEVSSSVDMVLLEESILAFWEKERIFDKKLEQNRKAKKNYSFIDGPITANNPMGMHHGWGRSLKDMIQRFRAMCGYELRYQNGFDCQGLWIEVEVEKALGLNSKKAIEDFGLEEFSNKCKQRLDKYSELITTESKRFGQWMDWDNSYYTHTDTNISYIWHFLKKCHENGWLFKGHLPMPWCSRCGTSLSQHEQHDSYKELTHTSVFVKFPLRRANKNDNQLNEFLLVWTTTPWTLTANTAVAVHPTLNYTKVKQNNEIYYLVNSRLSILTGKYETLEEISGKQLEGLFYTTPFKHLASQKNVEHKVVLWQDVGGEEGTGIVHIAPGCGAEDYQLSLQYNLNVLSPIDELGIFLKEYNEFAGLEVHSVSAMVIELLTESGLLYKKEQYKHRYPTCWRCSEELVFRLVNEWFINSDEIRPLLKQAVTKVEWIPSFYEKRMQDWLNNMGNWCISRKRYWGLPLPFYECNHCGKLTVIGTKEELLEAAVEGVENLIELHRPWIDEVKIKCSNCGEKVSRIIEVGDCWLDAGIVPFSTLKYLEDKDYWEKWFPIESICEMREQIRLWFYSQLFMSVTLTGKPPFKQVVVHEKVHDKDGRAMHRSWGNAIWFSEAVNKMGADIMRWSFVKQQLTQTMNFGYYLIDEIKPFFLTIWNVYSFFATFANLDEFTPNTKKAKELLKEGLPELDQWLLSKLNVLILTVRKSYEKMKFRDVTLELEKFVELLSTWYVRRSRRRFWKSENSTNKFSAYSTLYQALLTLSKLMAPIAPFFTERLYRNLTQELQTKNASSVHLTAFPKVKKSLLNLELNRKMDLVLELVRLGRSARNKANIRLRQPLPTMKIWCRNSESIHFIQEFKKDLLNELNIKNIKFVKNPGKLFKMKLKPNYKILGPKLKNSLSLLEEKIQNMSQKTILGVFNSTNQMLTLELENEQAVQLQLNEDLFLEMEAMGTYAIAVSKENAIALETTLTHELILEGFARDVIRQIQNLRKDKELQVSDEIEVFYDGDIEILEAIEKHATYIKNETLTKKLIQKEITDDSYSAQLNNSKLFLALSPNS